MEQLGPTLTEFYAPTTSNERKQQLEHGLHAFQSQPNAHLDSLKIIVSIGQRREQEDLFVLYFCGTTIEGAIRRRWSTIPKEERLQVRKFLFQYLAASHSSLPRWVVTKLGKALADLGKVSWPHEDPSFMTELMQLAGHEGTRVVGLGLLSLVSEEFVRPDSPLPDVRKKELKSSLVWALPSLLHVLAEVFAALQEAAAGKVQGATADSVRAAREALLAAARCLLVVVSWAPLTEHLTIDLFRSLFGVVEAAARGTGEGIGSAPPGSPSLQECGAACVACVTEVVSKRLLPRDHQDLVFGMADHMLALLKITTSEGSIRPGLEEDFLMQLAEFLGAFMEANLGRILGMGASVPAGPGSSSSSSLSSARRAESYPISELLSLLAAFTFAQPSTQGLQRCLRAWSAFVAQATIEEGEGSAADVERSAALARDSAGGLQSVCQALLEKSLFITNADALEELDDGGGGGDGGSNNHDWTAAGAEEEEGLGSGQHHAGAGGPPGGLSELEEFITEVRAVLLASSRVPGVGAALSESVLAAFATVLDHLDKTNSGSSSGSSDGTAAAAHSQQHQQARRLAADAANLCALMPATAAAAADGPGGSDGGKGLLMRAGEAVVRAAGTMASAGLHVRGPEFAALQAAALTAVGNLLPGLTSAGGAGGSGGGDAGDDNTVVAIAEAVVGLVRSCWESMGNGAGGELVPVAAGRLLLSLTTVLPPSALGTSQAVAALLKDAGQVAAGLPVSARVLLYSSLSAFLLPPSLLHGDMRKVTDLEGRSRAYSELVAPVLAPFSSAFSGWQGWAGSPPWPGFSDAGVSCELSSSCRILTRLCKAFASTPAKARRVLYQALSPSLSPLVALVQPMLEHTCRGSKEAATAAQGMLRLQVSVVECLGKEAGPTFASTAVGSLASAVGVGSSGDPAGVGSGIGAGPPWLSSGVFRLLASVLKARNKETRALVPQACELALGRLHALGRITSNGDQGSPGWGDRWLEGPVVETLPDFLDLSQELLVTQWHCFHPAAAASTAQGLRAGATTLAGALSAHVRAQEPSGGGQADGFASEAMGHHFSGIMTVIRLLLSLPVSSSTPPGDNGGGVVGGGGGAAAGGAGVERGGLSVPPDLVRRVLSVLEASHRAGGLFRFRPFVSVWLHPILTDALRGLVEGAHPLTQEEVRHLVFAMAEVDHRAFATEFLPHFLEANYSWLGGTQKEALLAPWRAGTHLDAPTFSTFLEAFASDLAFFRAQATAAAR